MSTSVPTLKIKVFLVVITFSLICSLIYYWSFLRQTGCSTSDLRIMCSQVKSSVHLSTTEEELKNAIRGELVLARKHLLKAKRYARSGITNAEVNKADDIIKKLGESLDLTLKTSEEGNSLSHVFEVSQSPVCPEEYIKKGSTTTSRTGWNLVNCTDKPLHSIVTILLNLQDYQNPDEQIITMLTDLVKIYPAMKVLVATDRNLALNTSSVIRMINISVNFLTVGKEYPGKVWNRLVKDVVTPYVLVGRDIERFYSGLQLERLIRVAHGLGVGAVGGALRLTKDGNWSTGCRQFEMKNYALAYIEGYDLSRNECLYCEHLTGPFISKPQLLSTLLFDQSLPGDVLFEDFFIRMKRANKLSMSCPDVMNFVRETDSKKKVKTTWLPLIKKWELNRVHLHSKETHSFSCEEAEIVCNSESTSTYRGLAVPICCLEILGRALVEIFTFCETNKIACLSSSGTVLGSVKMGSQLPWELDGDILYNSRNHSFFKRSMSHFEQLGYKVVEGKNGLYFVIWVHGWGIDFYADDEVGSEDSIERVFNTTLVNTDGNPYPSPFNPGYYVRSRYGHEIFWHVEHWIQHKNKKGFEELEPGQFTACPKLGHHACLDQYAVDGNIQFIGLWL